MTWLLPKNQLSVQQLDGISAPLNKHILITGGPGSGKTQMLVHRAAYLRDACEKKSPEFRIFVYTNVLKEYITEALEFFDLDLKCVTTYDSWCKKYFDQNISMPLPKIGKKPDFNEIRIVVSKHISENVRAPLFDFVLIDEGQDFDSVVYNALTRIARHVTVCADDKQQIYQFGSKIDEICGGLHLNRANRTLLEVFRCSPYISQVASAFINDNQGKREFLGQIRTGIEGSDLPLYYIADNETDEKTRLIEVVKTRSEKGDNVGILLPKKRLVNKYASVLESAGLKVEVAKKFGGGKLDFNTTYPKLTTYHSAKGLTFDTVILPQLIPMSFERFSDTEIQKLIFVGITRATKWVYFSSVTGDEIPEVSEILRSMDNSELRIQTFEEYRSIIKIEDTGSNDELDVFDTIT